MPKITNISFHVPRINYSVQSLIKNKQLRDKIISKTGINFKYKAAKNEYASDLVIKAAKKIKQKFLKKVDFFINCTQSNEYAIPGNASFIQSKIFKKKIPSIDLNIGCSGFVYALCLANSLIISREAKCVLVATSDTYSKYIDQSNYNVSSIFGDAASCTIVESSKENYFKKFQQGFDGSGANELIVNNSGLKKIKEKSNFLAMNGPAMFSFAIKEVPNCIRNLLKKNQLRKKNIDYFVFHQANNYMLENIKKILKIEDNKFIINSKYGNITSSSIPVALYEGIKLNKIKKKNLVVLAGFGLGLSWSSTIIKISTSLVKNIAQS